MTRRTQEHHPVMVARKEYTWVPAVAVVALLTAIGIVGMVLLMCTRTKVHKRQVFKHPVESGDGQKA